MYYVHYLKCSNCQKFVILTTKDSKLTPLLASQKVHNNCELPDGISQIISVRGKAPNCTGTLVFEPKNLKGPFDQKQYELFLKDINEQLDSAKQKKLGSATSSSSSHATMQPSSSIKPADVPTAASASSSSSSSSSSSYGWDLSNRAKTADEPHTDSVVEYEKALSARSLVVAPLKQYSDNALTQSKPTTANTICVAYDVKTGSHVTGFNAQIRMKDLHTELRKILKGRSDEFWSSANCAEVHAFNQMLQNGSNLKDIVCMTTYTFKKTKPPCENCIKWLVPEPGLDGAWKQGFGS